MSLFPAYAKELVEKVSETPQVENAINDQPSTSWLSNSSFPEFVHPPTINISSDSSDSDEIEFITRINKEDSDDIIEVSSSIVNETDNRKEHFKKRKKLKKSKKHEKHKITKNYELVVKDVYYDDTFRDKGNFKVDTLCSRVRPIYNLKQTALGLIVNMYNKKEIFNRYYVKITDKKKSKKLNTIIQKTKIIHNTDHDEFNQKISEAAEEKIKSKIKEYNEKLAEDPHDIDLWLEYIHFNDRDNDFETSHDKNTETIKYQRKLAIVEKALEKNAQSNELIKEKLKYMNNLLPADQYSNEIEAMIEKDPGNILLWQELISATRSSVAMCTVPKVINLYSKCFASLHLWSRTDLQAYDDRLLNTLYHSLIFLRQAGLWEQMWEIIRLNLNLNLSINKNNHYFKNSIDEKKLIDMEEVILTSKLPLNQLWLRVELLRENCHWMSVTQEELELIGDSHRFISPEDVTDFIHPLLSRKSNFKMVIYFLMALKIPLLPTRHQTLQDLDMKAINWSFDSLEFLIPFIYPCAGEMAGYDKRIALSIGLLEGSITSGPQYIRYHPAQESYIDFIRNVFSTVAESLSSENRSSIYIWWLRFERMILSLIKNSTVRIDKGSKKLKGILKDFLQKQENRNNLYYYREYALIKREMKNFDNCVNILETAIKTKGNIVKNVVDKMEQVALLSLYRTLLEVLLDTQFWTELNRTRILEIFSQMSDGKDQNECIINTEKYLSKFYKELLESPDLSLLEESLETLFFPNFYCDIVVCYVYFIFINSQDLEKIFEIYDKSLTKLSNYPHVQEQVYENQIAFLHFIYEKSLINLSLLREYLNKAMECYPNNFYILSVFAGIESELPHWSICTRPTNDRLWMNIALCLAGRARLQTSVCINDPIAMSAATNKLLHFHKRLSNNDELRCCPIIWRLYMLLLREKNLCEKKGEEIYHESVAYCPWSRCIYIDAAEIAPQLLTQIQDIIREKNLRMHVTPEELDILRG
ncbi:nuclear exosome regulator NRDE2 [Chelonus insularis]|uniref:nuclear exosome regulator NRDE2 n=1 Tax=Chelonus insularis TaxID=460826 RepID=UPI001588E208|nr:nuclear exosome regulator NRDE2 [Chelonus insularis]